MLSGVLADIIVILIIKVHGQDVAGILVNQQQSLIAVVAHYRLHTFPNLTARILQAVVARHAIFIEEPDPMLLEL
jgi:hypothetical protein